MALTMTRTRTQTTLTKLAQLVANVQGELAFLEGLVDPHKAPGAKAALEARRSKLVGDRDALYATLRQFDFNIDPCSIGVLETWRKRYGHNLGPATLAKRYITDAQK
jgi:hypothetical protein